MIKSNKNILNITNYFGIFFCLLSVLTAVPLGAITKEYIVDNFEDSAITTSLKWEFHGAIKSKIGDSLKTMEDSLGIKRKIGSNFLNISGKTNNWYVGGARTKLKKVIDPYTHFSIMIQGRGSNRSKVTVELSEVVLQDVIREMREKPDVYSYSIYVSWTGWKKVIIPLRKFTNKKKVVGNRAFDSKKTSPKWLKLEFLNDQKEGPITLDIDNVKFVTLEKI
ncbi:MAG: hypothetical protein DKM50_09965 [Candidatus Margulisiibacteriota bacterium]|nr:MAG: hypothetical protein A2X42_02560 [Candidatus Margulisbacteria bacterium GWF2_38_17]OGI06222.1 MAG: hypothetical protein A2X41_08140 [Candidatus Margulisbacteria bacterium GWE2_39_32]PZM78878.1 MAG: hypothetical protein DKM50_09965 [Candidatus Margulisiibacteriota bacterium]HCT84579.1 hypothetical protein [Candidatus Margulisiibacteriota bacterium]HCY37093.1 hypothetical protein [Candidatus Margulisiibacteriota bacterium]